MTQPSSYGHGAMNTKASPLEPVNHTGLPGLPPEHVAGERGRSAALAPRRGLTAERAGLWREGHSTAPPRWLGRAMEHPRGPGGADVLGRRQETVLLPRHALLAPWGLPHFETAGWGAYERPSAAAKPRVGPEKTQTIENQPSQLRPRSKQWGRRTRGVAKTERLHDLGMELCIKRYAFGRAL